MEISAKGLSLIKTFEGCRLKAYKPTPNDVWTIGVGHTHGVHEGMVITQKQADAFLRGDVAWAEKAVNALKLPLNQNQFDALVSFTFNLGAGILDASDDIGRLLRAHNWRAAANSMLQYDHQGAAVLAGLTRRRKAERALFLSKVVSHKVQVWLAELAALRAAAKKHGWAKVNKAKANELKADLRHAGVKNP